MLMGVGGCSTHMQSGIVQISAPRYREAFDAVKQTAHDYHFPLAFIDPRQGIVETETQPAGSILEPWEVDEPSVAQSLENTLMHQRRRVRFEFWPISPDSAQTAAAPDVLSLSSPSVDLTQTNSPLEIRVFVYMERSDMPGQQRSTWTRSKSSRYTTGDPNDQGIHWTVVGQDLAYGDELLTHLRTLLETKPNPQTAADPGSH